MVGTALRRCSRRGQGATSGSEGSGMAVRWRRCHAVMAAACGEATQQGSGGSSVQFGSARTPQGSWPAGTHSGCAYRRCGAVTCPASVARRDGARGGHGKVAGLAEGVEVGLTAQGRCQRHRTMTRRGCSAAALAVLAAFLAGPSFFFFSDAAAARTWRRCGAGWGKQRGRPLGWPKEEGDGGAWFK
jgi:hypothetical protein